MISKNFLKSSFIYTVVGALPLASSVILLPFYTNALGTSDFGQLAIYISLSLLIQIIASFGLDAAIGVHYFELRDQHERLKEYIWTIVMWLIIIGAGLTVISLLAGNAIFGLVLHDDTLSFFPYGFMSVLTGIFNSLFKTYSGLLINQQRPEKFFWVNLFNFIITITISLAGLYLYPHTLIGPMWGRLLSGIAIFLLSFYFFSVEFGYRFRSNIFRSVIPFCLPVLVYYLMSWVLSYIDRYIISNYMSARDVGIFDFAAKCTLLIEFVQAGLINSIQPKVFSIWKERPNEATQSEIGKYYSAFTALNLLMIPMLVLAFPVGIPWIVYKPEYYDSFRYLQLLCVSFVFRVPAGMFMAPLFYFKRTKMIPFVFAFTALVQVGAAFFLIRQYGLYGAVAAVLVVRPVQAVLLYYASRSVYTFRYNRIKLFLLPLAYAVLAVLSEIFFREYKMIYVHSVICLAVFVMVYFVYRKEIATAYTTILRRKV